MVQKENDKKNRIQEIEEQAGKQLKKIKQKNSQKEKEQSGGKKMCLRWKENMSCKRMMRCQRWQRDTKSNKQAQVQQESSLADKLTSLM